ncbi:similar to Saccharomyces cerevisiae YCL054W SPB1 AdoMet-dependent methyltransferase involved in rRNA processing and 60S ribosomal subunit maturation [Maudiozyma saulgeensis]|uniref:Similar to Saccharomyces cerevisiae YCL054W SPB1 AdoMet-dependent methyltransferase involved in rRNA processing and 60S ribosomal subunit maturation n=1 Tax=Maudiozyma saulgeensis TaxID=1789683 RepID=A0A1X7R3F2_9SACH|nr:similar to Saccharomyces cerevisiae YCL054W SPB1 AdoMet-dependent methyltransferase involved in rRNA processing and 60S ribosomal subunit maturation [Kazachstania saulgeensis]
MGRTQKKNSKGRLDRYYYLAKEKGYRARSSFKVIQINEKFGHFLEKSKVVIDLCAAPGSWCQVASKLCPVNSLIIGVDIVPMKPMPNVITFQSDITTEDCRSRLRGYMKTWKADTVLHDGAPNVGLGWVQDAFTQSQLTLQALKLAVENLVVNGTFVTKIFRSKDYNKLIWVFQQLFEKVEATKPPASRNVSAEIFVVCKGFKAPKKLDPRLLDPKEVFEELPDGPQNMEAKVYNPEKKVRKRQGYDEGDNLLYNTAPIMEFIETEDPITMLGKLNKFDVDPENNEWKIVNKMKQTNKELLACIEDLKVLGRKDFKMILRWRKNARDLLGLDKDEDNDAVDVNPLTEEEQIDKELSNLQEKQRLSKKREKRKKNETKQKEITRMQMNMLTPDDIGIEAANLGRESLFNLKTAEKTGILDKLAKGKKRMLFNDEELAQDNDIHIDEKIVRERDIYKDTDDLEAEMDSMYDNFKQRKSERDAKFRARQARGGDNEEEWTGFNDKKADEGENEESDYEMEDTGSELSDSDDDEAITQLISKIKTQTSQSKLSNKASRFFSNPIFDNIVADLPNKLNANGVDSESVGDISKLKPKSKANAAAEQIDQQEVDSSDASDSEDSDFEIVANKDSKLEDLDSDYDSEEEAKRTNEEKHKKELDIATVEAMTLAHQLATGQKTKSDLVNEGFNRYTFRDTDNLPAWFVEEEAQHSKINRPITKEAAMAIKEKMRALNARPIKKVAEAKARKKMRAVARLEKIKRKAGLINDDSDKSERDKAEEISRLMKKVTKKQRTKPQVTLVYASGSNRGLSGRPKGVKGKYKMVDGVLKNEQRALKRIAKKHHKKKK